MFRSKSEVVWQPKRKQGDLVEQQAKQAISEDVIERPDTVARQRRRQKGKERLGAGEQDTFLAVLEEEVRVPVAQKRITIRLPQVSGPEPHLFAESLRATDQCRRLGCWLLFFFDRFMGDIQRTISMIFLALGPLRLLPYLGS